MVTIKKIAEMTGFSRGTVDRVLNGRAGVSEETREIIKRAAKDLGYEPNLAGKQLAARKKNLKFGFIYIDSSSSPFFVRIYDGAQKAAEELTQYGVQVDFFKMCLKGRDEVEACLKQLCAEQYDGVALMPYADDSCEEIYIKYLENIPTVFYNMDNTQLGRLAYVGCDYEQAGRIAAGLAALFSNKQGKIGVYTAGDMQQVSYYRRMQGFRDELKSKYSHMEILGEINSYGFGSDDYAEIINFIKQNQDLNILYVVNPGDYGVCKKVHEQFADSVCIITNDLVEEQRKLLKSGCISATIDQEPEVQGYESLQILFRYLALGIPPEKSCVCTKLKICIAQNI